MSVFKWLPWSYRRAGAGSPANWISVALGQAITRLDADAKLVAKGHLLEACTDLEDADRLASWFRLEPWPAEDRDTFRDRVRQMVAIYLRGAASAERMIRLVQIACGAQLASTMPQPGGAAVPAILRPRACGGFDDLLPGQFFLNDRYTTLGVATRVPADPGAEPFLIRVVDLPLMEEERAFLPDADGRLDWLVKNTLYGDPEDPFHADGPRPERHPEPRIFIEAADDRALALPVIAHRTRRRAVLVNRILPPGCTLEVDLENGLLREDPSGPASTPGPLTLPGGASAPDLLYGRGALFGDGRFSQHGLVPSHLARWYTADALVRDESAPPLADAGDTLAWPPLLERGTLTSWRLLVGAYKAGAATLPLRSLRYRRTTLATAPAGIRLAWYGRRPGTFTIRFDRDELSPAGDGELAHRHAWFLEQVQRLKVAGMLFIPQEETAGPEAEVREDDLLPPPSAELVCGEADARRRIAVVGFEQGRQYSMPGDLFKQLLVFKGSKAQASYRVVRLRSLLLLGDKLDTGGQDAPPVTPAPMGGAAEDAGRFVERPLVAHDRCDVEVLPAAEPAEPVEPVEPPGEPGTASSVALADGLGLSDAVQVPARTVVVSLADTLGLSDGERRAVAPPTGDPAAPDGQDKKNPSDGNEP